MKTIEANLTLNDFVWVSRKLISQYSTIKNSDTLCTKEKNEQIMTLVCRAERFGLTDLISFFGYELHVINLENNREAKMILPKNYNLNDIEIVKKVVANIPTN